MKIASSSIAFQSTHSSIELNQKQENLQFWVGAGPEGESSDSPGVAVSISVKGLELQRSLSGTSAPDEEMVGALSSAD